MALAEGVWAVWDEDLFVITYVHTCLLLPSSYLHYWHEVGVLYHRAVLCVIMTMGVMD